jgi:hypothetical protein
MVKRLLLEGRDDRHVLGNLLYNHGFGGALDYKEKDGIEHLLESLADELEATDADRFGIVVDADVDLPSRWAKLQGILIAAGYTEVPGGPDPTGTVIPGPDGKVVGVWIMPDNRVSGMLEDFVGSFIEKDDSLWPKAQSDVNGIPNEHRKFKPTYLSKAMVHTWLAWQEEPGTRLGETFKKRYLRTDGPLAVAFVNWIQRLLA